jgi:CheY-like chemotaxis protein
MIDRRKIKIMLVDDEPVILKMEREALKSLGVTVIEASSGVEAIKKLANEKPDVLFLDLVLPDMTGESIVKFVKSSEALKNVSVIVVTAKEDAETIERCYRSGCDGYITKPIKPEAFVEKAILALSEKGIELEE